MPIDVPLPKYAQKQTFEHPAKRLGPNLVEQFTHVRSYRRKARELRALPPPATRSAESREPTPIVVPLPIKACEKLLGGVSPRCRTFHIFAPDRMSVSKLVLAKIAPF